MITALRLTEQPLQNTLAVGGNLLAIWFAARIAMHGQMAHPGNENRS